MANEQKAPEDVVREFAERAHPGDTIYVSIDPGADGAIGFLCRQDFAVVDIPTVTVRRAGKTKKGNPKTTEAFDLPGIVRIFRQLNPARERVRVCLEKAQVMVKGKGSSLVYTAFRVGVGYGMWPLFLALKGYSVEEATPSVWKKAMGLAGKDKGDSLHMARGLWPQAPLARKQDHNRAEALLLGEYYRRKTTGRLP